MTPTAYQNIDLLAYQLLSNGDCADGGAARGHPTSHDFVMCVPEDRASVCEYAAL